MGRKLFNLFLQQEHSEENLQFWNEVNTMKEVEDSKEKLIKMRSIYKEFIKPMALKEVFPFSYTNTKMESLKKNSWKMMFDNLFTYQIFLKNNFSLSSKMHCWLKSELLAELMRLSNPFKMRAATRFENFLSGFWRSARSRGLAKPG